MTLLITEKEVERCVSVADMPRAIDLIEDAYRHKAQGHASLHARMTMQYPTDTGYYTDSAVRQLSGILPDMDSAALRIYPISHGVSAQTDIGGRIDYSIGQEVVLYYRYNNSMELAAIMADYRMMNLRTAAPTGVATRWLAREDSAVLGVLGSGRHAQWQIAAVCAVRPIEEVRIFSPTRANRERLSSSLDAELPQMVRSVGSPREAVRDADVVVTVTNANRPVIDCEWLAPGTHVNVVARGEIDSATVLRAKYIACSWRDQILHDTPDFNPVSQLVRTGEIEEEWFRDLDEVIENRGEGRRTPADLTLFLSQGVGIWDAALAPWVYGIAREKGLGLVIDFSS